MKQPGAGIALPDVKAKQNFFASNNSERRACDLHMTKPNNAKWHIKRLNVLSITHRINENQLPM